MSGRVCWSWAALGAWLARAGLALAIAAGLLVGPELADRAWDRGIHITPGQAALHYALMADGFTHHHGHGALPGRQPATAAQDDAPSVQPPGAGMTWGTPLAQALQMALPAIQPQLAGPLLPSHQARPDKPAAAPPTPPPEAR